MALRAGLATALMQSAERLWFTKVNGYGSYEREKKRQEDTET
jgi:hypothetical protein